MSTSRLPVLLDTDIGSDIDDAVCLAYLLANPAIDLLGITTVTGDTVLRASLASVLCKIAGQSVPIYPGRREPLLIEQKQPHVPQAAALSRWDHDTTFPREEAVLFLRDTIRAHPGQITLLGIGPMTNIAALFALDEEIPSLLKGLVLMCGSFSGINSTAEWNAKLDPTATAIVYRARPPLHRSIGLDVTNQVKMPADDVRRKFQAPLLRPVLDFAEVWFQHAQEITFHDPLAATTLDQPDICGYEMGRVEVETHSPIISGATLWYNYGEERRHQVATTVDPKRFFAHYFSFFE
jgi:inosine-uridine nucleoside N-ribohydrolase